MTSRRSIFKTLYDIFPILNRPLALCAAISSLAVYFMYRNAAVSLSLLALFSILSVLICVLTKNRKIIIISILFLAVCASTVNEFARINDLKALDGDYINADFVAIEDSKESGIARRVTAYCRNSSEIPENTKFELYYFFKTDIKCGNCFNALVRLTELEDNEYKADKVGRSVYMNCKIQKINEMYKNEPFFTLIGKARTYIKQTINNNFSADDASLLIALNTGDRSELDDGFYENVRTCGVSHILVVSGLHISIILGAFFFLVEKFFYNKYLKALISIFIIFMLCAVCGFTLSVLRAGCMFLFSAVSPIFMRKNDSFNSLGSAVVLLIFISPLSILSVGFWLSVSATVAVVWIAPFYGKLIIDSLKVKSKVLSALISVFTVSLAAMILTAPISLAVFGYVSLLSPITFLLLTYPVTFALAFNCAGLLFSLAGNLSFISLPFFFVSGLCAKYIRFVIEYLGTMKFLCIKSGVFSFIFFIVLAVVLIVAMYQYKFYKKLLRQNFIKGVQANANSNGKRVKRNASTRRD